MMQSITSTPIIRQKAKPEILCKTENEVNLFHPREDSMGNYFVSSHAGEILRFKENGEMEVICTIDGQPNCLAFDNTDTLFIADLANAAIYFKEIHEEDKSKKMEILVKDCNSIPFKGPTSIAISKEEDTLVFCDGGYFGTTSLNNPKGSIYIVEIPSKTIRPLLLNCLSYPSDIAFDTMRSSIYICETFTNRIIRVFDSNGSYNTSLFYQFQGRVGPTAICVDEAIGNLYVARYDFKSGDNDVDGIISFINKDGVLLGELTLPSLPEITGLMIPSKNKDLLYITEKNTNGVIKVKLSSFLDDLDKLEESNNKLFS